MAEGSVRHPWQSPLVCGMCGDHQDVLWYCTYCKGDLCTNCKRNHNDMPIFKNHQIISRSEALVQKNSEKCSSHKDQQYILHCNTCVKLVCTKCITVDHKGHDLSEISDAMTTVQQKLNDFSNRLQTDILPKYESDKSKIENDIAAYEKWFSELHSNVNDRRTDLKLNIDSICDETLHQAEAVMKNKLSEMEDAKQKLEENIKTISQLATCTKEVLTKSNLDQIDFVKDRLDVQELETPKLSPLELPKFHSGKTDTNQIKAQVGQLHIEDTREKYTKDVTPVPKSAIQENPKDARLKSKVNPRIQAIIKPRSASSPTKSDKAHPIAGQGATSPDFFQPGVHKVEIVHTQRYDNKVENIVPISAREAWISERFKTQIKLVHTRGHTVRTLTHLQEPIYDFVILPSKDIMLTCISNALITQMSLTGEVTATKTTNPLHPSGICLCNNNRNIAVCMNNEDTMRSVLVIYSTDLKNVLQNAHYSEKVVYSYSSQKITQNNNGDFCIAHHGLKAVFVVCENGKNKFMYAGEEQTKDKFNPKDVCCNSNGTIFISDVGNNSIHMLDHHGNYLGNLLRELDGISNPVGLNTDNQGRLWIGHENSLSVVKYAK